MTDRAFSNILLIATVGGAPEPLVASIRKWDPKKILFVPSSGTADQINGILDLLARQGDEPGAGLFETLLVSDHQDFSGCVREMRDGLEERVTQWRARGDGYGCVADFTGGTKCMSAALALVARPWPAVQFSYVGGALRDKGGAGVVVAGEEHVVSGANPWDMLGYQVVEEAVAAFDRRAYDWGAERLRSALSNIAAGTGTESRKSELNALAKFMQGYDQWDQSAYKLAFDTFGKCAQRLNDLAAVVAGTSQDWFGQHIDQARNRLEELKRGSGHPTRALLEDLIVNAARRREEGRHVDAVARLYRATEAAAQLRLWEEFKIDTGKVPMEDVPESLQDRLEARGEDGTVKLALQDAYKLLLHKQDPLGECFVDLGWDGCKSPLSERNESIAGHGFKPVSSGVSEDLWKGALLLADISEEDVDVLQFPRIGCT